ncbi:MAG: rhodanese-like domain-containing protein [Alphaproteobacteria bacterium]|nr:rhodanese-like domain-containing protein [Alphaproteobacteria bacterium]
MAARVTPGELVELRALVYDIRLWEEREVMGWIPGSLHRPPPASLDDLLDEERPVVLACATGRRSLELADRLAGSNVQVLDLAGGLLSWQADFPVCRVPEGPTHADDALSMEAFVKQIRSCFVVESVESGAIEAPAVDPVAAVSEILDGIETDRKVTQLWARIDALASQAWVHGHRLDFIAEHVMQFYALALKVKLAP